MPETADLTATEALRAMEAGRLTPATLLEACLERIAAREDDVRAFAHFDADAVRQARVKGGAGAGAGRLHGIPIGVKDVLDTAGMPTGYNSPIWAGHQPRADAAPVAWAVEAGAVVMGKTVTTEFATRTPGPTTNPWDKRRTPGGSSSGSAAGVGAGFFPVAYGTQTAGSVIRPAAYCGVVGFKPTFGAINRHGMKLMSESLDTIGVMARSVADCALVTSVLSGLDLGDPEVRAPAPRVGLCWTFMRGKADAATEALMERVGAALAAAGAVVVGHELPAAFDAIEAAHGVVMNAESARAMGWELAHHREKLSPTLREKLTWGAAQSGEALAEARATFRQLQDAFPAAMGDCDILVTPSAPGEAPLGLEWTGDPAFNLIWTSLHVPCVTVPAGLGPSGMPLGIQIVARRGADAAALAWAAWVSAAIA